METWQTIEAFVWRENNRQKREVAMSWRTAALSRQKRLPPLARLLMDTEAKPLTADEKEKRHNEFEQMVGGVNFDALNKARGA
jgi:hypothetical protein